MNTLQPLSISLNKNQKSATTGIKSLKLTQTAPSQKAAKKEVVIIEDNDVLRILFQRLLEKEFDVSISFKQNGMEGLEYARQTKPDLVILDLMLPGMNGFDVLRKIKSEGSLGQTKVMIVSAKATSDDIEKGFELMADEYLTKPFHPKEFLARIRKLFLQHR